MDSVSKEGVGIKDQLSSYYYAFRVSWDEYLNSFVVNVNEVDSPMVE